MLTTIHGLEAVKFALSGDFPRSFESGGVSALFFLRRLRNRQTRLPWSLREPQEVLVASSWWS